MQEDSLKSSGLGYQSSHNDSESDCDITIGEINTKQQQDQLSQGAGSGNPKSFFFGPNSIRDTEKVVLSGTSQN